MPTRRPPEPILPVTHPSWEEKSAMLLAYLDQPRDWKHLKRWRKLLKMKSSLLSNCLAYLKTRGKAKCICDYSGGIYWVKDGFEGEGFQGYPPRKEEIAEPELTTEEDELQW